MLVHPHASRKKSIIYQRGMTLCIGAILYYPETLIAPD
eukprot:SAG22_NODE_15161_length_355_cov_1.039062_1_plen_37_part_01